MASCICITCKEIAFGFTPDMYVERMPTSFFEGNHDFWTIAKGNSIEGVEAK